MSDSIKSAKGAARTAKGGRNCFAPRSVLRGFLKRMNPLAIGLGMVAALTLVIHGQPTAAAKIQLTNRKVLAQNAGRVAWSPADGRIAYDKIVKNGLDSYYQIWTMKPDGSDDTCLTCRMTALPALHKGNPVWSPDGKFIVFQAQDPPSHGWARDFQNFPGSGWNNDLWATDTHGKFWQLTNVGGDRGGVIYPTFSWDGTKLAWGQRLSPYPNFGSWELAVGTFTASANGIPSITNIKYYTPGANHFYYEPHSFSRDDQTLFFMGNLQPGEARLGMDIYALNLVTGTLKNLTNTLDQWNEFPETMPTGNKLVYMSTADTGWGPHHFECDLWSMNYDGSDKRRLTFYNDPKSPDYVPEGICLCDPRWNSDGSQLVVYDNQIAVYDAGRSLHGRGPGGLWLFNVGPAKQ